MNHIFKSSSIIASLAFLVVVAHPDLSYAERRNKKGAVELADSDKQLIDDQLCGYVNDSWLPGKENKKGQFLSYRALFKFFRKKMFRAEDNGDDYRADRFFNKFRKWKRRHKQSVDICQGNDSDSSDDSSDSGGNSAPQADGKHILIEENPTFPASNSIFTRAVRAYIQDRLLFTIAVGKGRSIDAAVHAAHIGLELLDNDEDGVCDSQAVCDELYARNQGAIVFVTESQENNMEPWDPTQSLRDDDVKMDSVLYGGSNQSYDFTIEEVLHYLTDNGWGRAYPSVFGSTNNSTWGQYVNEIISNNLYDPTETGDTELDDIETTVSESLYWVVTCRTGSQDYSWRIPDISSEWPSYNRALLLQNVPSMLALIEDPQYGWPQNTPDGQYAPALSQ